VRLMTDAGFEDAAFEPLTLGSVHLYRGRWPGRPGQPGIGHA